MFHFLGDNYKFPVNTLHSASTEVEVEAESSMYQQAFPHTHQPYARHNMTITGLT